MADTASLVARVKTEGVTQADAQLDAFAATAATAAGQAAAYERAQAKAAAEAKKSTPIVKSLSDVTESLGNKIAVLEEAQINGARSAAILAAQLKLGADASQAEIKLVGDLTGKLYDMSAAQTQAGAATGKAAATSAKGMGQARQQMQQVGFQLQDLVVQLQGGTSAFVAIGQQGSQLAGAFGPGGAVLGAVIALASAAGGVLYKAFSNTTSSIKDVEKGAKELSSSFQTAKDGTIELSDALVTLSQNGDLAATNLIKLAGVKANQQLFDTTQAIKAQSAEWTTNKDATGTAIAELDNLIKTGRDVTTALANLNGTNDVGARSLFNLSAQVDGLASKYGTTSVAVSDVLVAQRQFNSQPTAANAQNIADALRVMAADATKGQKEINDQATAAQELAVQLSTAERQINAVADAQKNAGAATNSTTKAYQDQTARIIKSQQDRTKNDKDRARAEAETDKAAFAQRQNLTKQDIDAFNKSRDLQADQEIARINATEAKAAEAQQKRIENEAARQQKAADDFLAQIDRTSGDELNRITVTEQQKLEKLAEFRQQNLISEQEFEQARTDIQTTAETARQEALKKKREEEAQKQGRHDQFIADIEALNATELEMIDVQQQAKEAKAKEFRDRGIINEKEYQASIAAIAKNADDKRLDVYSDGLSDMTSNLKTALGENNALYKAAAITQTIIDTYKGAQAAYASFATIPVVGPALGVAAAAAAVAAGLARVQSIRSAREQGGNLSPGQISTIAERGQPEVIMPAGASRVRTAQQMRQIMGENGGVNRTPNVQIVNQTTGRVDSVTSEQIDETQIRVIIRETVSTDMNDSNSVISRARRGTRGQPGF